jgi:hypothetical protein
MMFRSTRRSPGRLWLLLLGCAACDPYDRFGEGESDLGPVDPVNFPPANLGLQDTGAPGNRKQPGQGSFSAVPAFVAGEAVGYYTYPFPRAALAADPLLVGGDEPPAYVFAAGYKCTAPAGYKRNARLDEVPYDVQGNIFTALPEATYSYERLPQSSYVPIVAQIPVTSPKLPCQQPKSEEALLRLGGDKERKPDGNLLAWLIIDPAAPVYGLGESVDTSTGVGLQRWGWFNRYLVAYLDGGPVAVKDETVMVEGMPMTVPHMVTERLYYPRSLVMTADGMGPGELGAGYDVLAAKRGADAYSPVCEVVSYDAGAMLAAEALPKDAATVEAMFDKPGNFQPGDPPYVFCLQLEAP